MKKTDLEILRKYLSEFILYLCKEERIYDIGEVATVLKCVEEIIEEVENDRED